MWSYVVTSLGVSVATWLILYLDSRLLDKPKTKGTYIKTIVMVNALVFAVLGIMMWLSPTQSIAPVLQSGGGGAVQKIVAPNAKFIAEIGEEMLGGDAPF